MTRPALPIGEGPGVIFLDRLADRPMPLLLIGASVRSLAQSARRAGLDPTAIDLFADRDLLATCPARRVDSHAYPHDLDRLASGLAAGPWMYAGALENHP